MESPLRVGAMQPNFLNGKQCSQKMYVAINGILMHPGFHVFQAVLEFGEVLRDVRFVGRKNERGTGRTALHFQASRLHSVMTALVLVTPVVSSDAMQHPVGTCFIQYIIAKFPWEALWQPWGRFGLEYFIASCNLPFGGFKTSLCCISSS